ncbi:MAG: hypothetical protein U0271_41810 [Polyangiaceae bacterium]
MRRWFWVFALGWVGCGVNPVPEPPEPGLDGDPEADGCGASCDGPVRLAGAATESDRIFYVNLDGAGPPFEVAVAPDGTYQFQSDAQPGDEVRIQPRRGSLRGEPADFLVVDAGALSLAPRPLADCFQAPAEIAVDFSSIGSYRASLSLTNQCASELTIASIGARTPTTEFAVSAPATPLALAPGETLSVDIAITSETIAPEEVVLIEISAPVVDRRAITVFSR